MAANAGSINAGKAVVILGLDATPLKNGLNSAKAELQAWAASTTKVGAAVAALGAAMEAPFLKGLSVLSDWGKEISRASRQTGIGFENLGSLSFATGGDLDALAHGVEHMSVFLVSAARSGTSAADALARLKLSYSDLNGMNQADRFRAIQTALAGIADEGERIQLGKDIFGRGAMNLNLAGDMAAREQRGRDLGAVMSTSDVNLAKEYSRAWGEFGVVTKAIWAEVGAVIAPIMTTVGRTFTDALIGVRRWVNENRSALGVVFAVGAGLATLGSAIVTVGGGLFTAGTAFGFMATTLGTVASAAGVVVPYLLPIGAAVGAIWLAAKYFGVTWAAVWDGVKSVASGVWDRLTALFQSDLFKRIIGAAITVGVVLGYISYWVGKLIYDFHFGESVWGSVFGNLAQSIRFVWEVVKSIGSAIVAHWVWVFTTVGNLVQPLLAPAIGFFNDRFLPMITSVGSAIMDTVSETVNRVQSLVGSLAGQMSTTFGAVANYLQAGDISGAFNTVVTSLQLAWAKISDFGEGVWNLWRHTALSAIETIKNFLVDAFHDASTGMRLIFAQAWSDVKVVFLQGLAEVARLAADVAPTSALRELMNSQRQSLTLEIQREQRVAQPARQAQIMDQAAGERNQRQGDRDYAQAMLDTERQIADLERGSNQDRIATLERELEALDIDAEFRRRVAEVNREMGAPETGGGIVGTPKLSVAGAFGADALNLFGGMVDPAQEAVNIADDQRQLQRQMVQQLRLIAQQRGVVFS